MTIIIISDINDISDLPEYSGDIFVNICELSKEWEAKVVNESWTCIKNFYDAIDNSKIFINNEFNNILINIIKCIKNKYLLTELLLTYDNNSITKIICLIYGYE